MKHAIIFTILFFIAQLSFALNYYFSGVEDNLYHNPANWSPAYPGTIIREQDIVIIQSDVSIGNDIIEVKGKVEIELGTYFTAESGGIKNLKSGFIINNGIINIHLLDNAGRFENQVLGRLNLINCNNRKQAVINNYFSGKITSEKLVNEGVFHNYSKCAVSFLFNKSEIFQYSKARLEVKNTFEEFPNSNIIPSVFAVFYAKETKTHVEAEESYFSTFSSRAEL